MISQNIVSTMRLLTEIQQEVASYRRTFCIEVVTCHFEVRRNGKLNVETTSCTWTNGVVILQSKLRNHAAVSVELSCLNIIEGECEGLCSTSTVLPGSIPAAKYASTPCIQRREPSI